MARKARTQTPTSARRPSRKTVRHHAKRGVLMASVGGLGLVWVFGLAGCAAVVAGAAAGMLASRTGGSGAVDVSTPTIGEGVDQLADSAGQVLARTIKEGVPRVVRAVPAGTPKVAGKPTAVRTPGIATPMKAAEPEEPVVD